jgi:hypothetical protein
MHAWIHAHMYTNTFALLQLYELTHSILDHKIEDVHVLMHVAKLEETTR